jgi:2-polyprenyl-3-methyl-5-hydroxy-6-metoxy-1,4-benzoquinol methylase
MTSFTEKLDNFLVKYLAYFNYQNYVKKLKLKGTEKVLEIGSGGGNLSRFLTRELFFGKLVCLDKSKYWIKIAKKRLKSYMNIQFKKEDILRFNLKNCFDTIIIHYVLHDIPKKNKLVNSLSSLLKREGKIFIREPTRKNHGISKTKIEKLMLCAGLKKIFSKETNSFPLRGKVYEGIFDK